MRYVITAAGVVAAVLGATPNAHAAWSVAGASNSSPAAGVNGTATRVQTPVFGTGSKKPSCNSNHKVKVEWTLGSTGRAPTSYRLTVALGTRTTHENFTAPASTYVSSGTFEGDVSVTLSSRLGSHWIQAAAPVAIKNC